MMLSVMAQYNLPPTQQRQAICPSCHTRNWFVYAGEQHWPLKVAQSIGIDPVIPLWHCDGCNSTVSECELR